MDKRNVKPIALDAYDQLAEAYAAVVDIKPHNAYYDRPAVLSLLPEVNGKHVLDAGCGPGVYSEWLIQHGAHVIAVDASPRMVSLAQKRLGDTADVRQADLGQPLDFLETASFDLVISPLVLDYIEDWHGVFGEFHRVLRTGGHLVFSIGHPFWDYLYFKTDNYFSTEQKEMVFHSISATTRIPVFRRPLQAIINPLLETGFALEHLLEPQPTPEFAKADPSDYERLMHEPNFLCVRARKA